MAKGDFSHGPASLPVEGPTPGGEIQWLHNPTKDTTYVSLVGSQWFMNPLGRAYLLTGDELYAKTFAWVFESWFDHQDEIVSFLRHGEERRILEEWFERAGKDAEIRYLP